MLSEKEVRSLMRNELHMFEYAKDDAHMSRIMLLAEVLQIDSHELADIVDKGYKEFHVVE